MSKKKQQQQVLELGITYVFGHFGSGKSTFALTCGADPEKAVFIDDDAGKSRAVATQLGWRYIDLLEETEGMDEIAFHQHVLDLIDGLPDDLDVIAFDNAKRFFNSGDSWFISAGNWKKYRKEIRGTPEIYGGIQWRTMRESHYPSIYSKLARKAKLVIFTTHEKPHRDDAGVKTGAMEAAADKSLVTAANMVIRLTQNKTGHPAPVGLVVKNIGRIMSDGSVLQVLPPRVEPCTWQAIREYAETPVGNKAFEDLEPHERLSEEEHRLVEGTLSPEQRMVYDFYREIKKMRANERVAEAVLEVASRWDGPENKMMYNFIARELSGDYELDADDVKEILEAAKEEKTE